MLGTARQFHFNLLDQDGSILSTGKLVKVTKRLA
jgi:hypothetical protein